LDEVIPEEWVWDFVERRLGIGGIENGD